MLTKIKEKLENIGRNAGSEPVILEAELGRLPRVMCPALGVAPPVPAALLPWPLGRLRQC